MFNIAGDLKGNLKSISNSTNAIKYFIWLSSQLTSDFKQTTIYKQDLKSIQMHSFFAKKQ